VGFRDAFHSAGISRGAYALLGGTIDELVTISSTCIGLYFGAEKRKRKKVPYDHHPKGRIHLS